MNWFIFVVGLVDFLPGVVNQELRLARARSILVGNVIEFLREQRHQIVAIARTISGHDIPASSAESVGALWLGEAAEVV